jgi:hypothetical protein
MISAIENAVQIVFKIMTSLQSGVSLVLSCLAGQTIFECAVGYEGACADIWSLAAKSEARVSASD